MPLYTYHVLKFDQCPPPPLFYRVHKKLNHPSPWGDRWGGRCYDQALNLATKENTVAEQSYFDPMKYVASQIDTKLQCCYAKDLCLWLIKAGLPPWGGRCYDQAHQHLIKHPAATFFVRVSGESMINAGIFPGDILIVDRSLEAVDKKIVIAVINGDLTVKRLRIRSGNPFLEPENDQYSHIEITPDMAFEIWGVVTNVIHKV